MPIPPKSAMRQFTDSWMAAFQEVHGDAYLFCGAKDGTAAARLIAAGFDPEDLMRMARAAWANPHGFWCKQAITLAGFASRFNEIRQELKTGTATGRSPTISELMRKADALKAMAESIKRAHASMGDGHLEWHSESKRDEFRNIRREIINLNERIARYQ